MQCQCEVGYALPRPAGAPKKRGTMASTTRHFQSIALSLLVLFAAGMGLAACGRKGGDHAAPSISDPIVAATVNGKPIYVSDVQSEAVERGLIREGEELDEGSDQFYQILEDLIETRLFSMEAESRQLDRNADVRHRVERARELILAGALNDQIQQTAIDEDSIAKMYKEQIRVLRSSREVHLREMVFDSREAATAAKRRLDNGEAFEALAYQLSVDRRTAAEGGDMGWVIPEQLPEVLRSPASSTAVGQTNGPFQSDKGWMLLKVEDRREEAPPSLAALRPQIERWLMFEEQRKLVEQLKSKAKIERLVEQNKGFATPGAAAAQDAAGEARRGSDPEVPLGPGALAGSVEPAPVSPTTPGLAPAPASPLGDAAGKPVIIAPKKKKPVAPLPVSPGAVAPDAAPAAEPPPKPPASDPSKDPET